MADNENRLAWALIDEMVIRLGMGVPSPPEQQLLAALVRKVFGPRGYMPIKIPAEESPSSGWAKVCAALGMTEDCGADHIVERILGIRQEMREANEILAAYCPECDPSRSSLASTVGLLVSDVLNPRNVVVHPSEPDGTIRYTMDLLNEDPS